MVTLTLPVYFSEEFVRLIPEQRAMIVRLLTEGKLASFSLSMERSHGWMVANADSVQKVEALLDTFPMIDFFEYEIAELAMYDVQHMGMPQVMLN